MIYLVDLREIPQAAAPNPTLLRPRQLPILLLSFALHLRSPPSLFSFAQRAWWRSWLPYFIHFPCSHACQQVVWKCLEHLVLAFVLLRPSSSHITLNIIFRRILAFPRLICVESLPPETLKDRLVDSGGTARPNRIRSVECPRSAPLVTP